MIAFWIQDIGGLYQLVEIVMLIFAGFLLPIELFPSAIAQISFMMPFSYMIYFPVVAFQGKLPVMELLHVIEVQSFWLVIFTAIYMVMWRNGIRKFTAFGQ